MEKVFAIIKRRYSVRTYEDKLVEPDKVDKLRAYLAGNTKGPFGSAVRFELVDAAQDTQNELKQYVSYGNVKGARLFIAGSVARGECDMEDFGYCMEKNILYATSLGLGTVWLGGSLNRTTFAKRLRLSENETIPAITPVGYPAEKRTLMDKALRAFSGGNNRKPFNELFFNGDFSSPLAPEDCGEYAEVLEAVRLAPSASNKQPWRIVKGRAGDAYHFYIHANIVNSAIKEIRLQNNDIGIAMCHFELTAKEKGLSGSWRVQKPDGATGNLPYIVSWIG